ncbi:hypothetical protein [Mycoplasma seminis]|uniref:Uncharacterized protein n=1 Tax=Mycoplasma seminis TaxID=512749 RepID=A0ABY9H9F5_9MOLU|nr:hypothetical protein [Mycoplasma seminis]WLP85225.1 hypothetical protein Q8852_02795 [Mycoplasma seminis]
MKILSKEEKSFVWVNFKDFDLAGFYIRVVDTKHWNEVDTKELNIKLKKYFNQLCKKNKIELIKINYSFEDKLISFELANNEDIPKLINCLLRVDISFGYKHIFVNVGKVIEREISCY